MADINARDRTVLVDLVQTAQLVDAFGRFPKKQFMDRPHDQARVAERVIAMRKRAGDLSASFRKEHADAPWNELEEVGRTPEELWKAAKKITPKLLAELEPLLADMPEAAFVIAETRRGTRRASARTAERPKGDERRGGEARKDRSKSR
jgi:uncharacterized protein with HEPN domain